MSRFAPFSRRAFFRVLAGVGVVALVAAIAAFTDLFRIAPAVTVVLLLIVATLLIVCDILLANARASRESERDHFRAMMAGMHDAIVETDWKGIRDVNNAFCKMTGFARDELIGAKAPYAFWPIEQYASIAAALENSMRGAALDFELVLNRKNGERFPVLLSVSRILEGSGNRVLYSFRDITRIRRNEVMLEGQRAVFEAIARDKPLYEILLSIVKLIEDVVPGAMCSILLLSRDGKTLQVAAAPRLPPALNAVVENFPIGPDKACCGAAAFYKKRRMTADTQTDPNWTLWKEHAAHFKLFSCTSEPILAANGDLLGTFAIYRSEKGLLLEEFLRVMETAAYLASIAVERQREVAALRRAAGGLPPD